MNQHCPLQDSSTCQHRERKGICGICQFDFETLDPDEGMFKLRRVNAESVFSQHEKAEGEKQKASADAAEIAALKAKLVLAESAAAVAKAQAEKAEAEAKKAQAEALGLRNRLPPPHSPPQKTKAATAIRYPLIRADGSRIPSSAEPEMIAIPAGHYLRGSHETEDGWRNSEYPQVQVSVPGFEIGVTPVTVGMWKQYVADNQQKEIDDPSPNTVHSPPVWEKQTDEHPVVDISWHDAQAYIAWVNETSEPKNGRFRLPSEAEWEYAARADSTTPFHYGNTINTNQANFDGSNNHYPGTNSGDYRKCTTPVKSFQPNDFGLYEIHGNVWEWCEDVWHDNYRRAPADGSVWNRFGDQGRRIVRGGSWFTVARLARTAYRNSYKPDHRNYDVGFRLARTVF